MGTRQAGRHAGRCWNFLSRQECVYNMPFSHGRNTDTFHVSNDSNFTLISSAFDLPNWQNSISANTFSMDTPTHIRTHARTHSLVETHTHTQMDTQKIRDWDTFTKNSGSRATYSRSLAPWRRLRVSDILTEEFNAGYRSSKSLRYLIYLKYKTVCSASSSVSMAIKR